MKRLWCNGQWLDPHDFSVSVTDRGLTHGLGLFETVLATDGRPVFAGLHLARLRDGCARLGWTLGFPDLEEAMAELIRLNGVSAGRSRIRLAVSAGSGAIHDLTPGPDRIVWMTMVPVAERPLSTTANLSPWVRNERSPLAGLKCASYAENLLALRHAQGLGFGETVFLNTRGEVCEAATSNVFLVKNGALHTPPPDSGCLPGITRAVVIRLAANLGLACNERSLSAEALELADELFLTSSIRGVVTVSRFGQRDLAPGPVAPVVREAWEAETRRRDNR